MRNIIFALLLGLMLLLSGCVSAVTKDKVNKFAAQTDGFVQKIENNQVTQEELRSFPYAVRVHAHILNWQVNDVEPPSDVKLLLNIGE